MRILVIADGRSPITRNWVGDLIHSGHDVVLVSTFPHESISGLKAEYSLPICFSRFAGNQTQGINTRSVSSNRKSRLRAIIRRYRGLFQQLRYWIGPLSFFHYRRELRKILSRHGFDLVHVLRIPFEGLFAVPVLKDQKVVVSIWGNDLTLHAPKNAYMRRATRRVLARANGLIVDVKRDIDLAYEWGYAKDKPVMVALTSGGIDIEMMHNSIAEYTPENFSIPEGKIVINPRGIRPGYIRNDTFFAAIPLVLASMDEPVHFLCPSMAGQSEAEHWVHLHHVEEAVTLLPFLSQQELWYCFSKSQVMVSPSTHDGTPNSLLESMVMGSIPVVGDIASLREWVVDKKNGYLIDPSSPEKLAAAIITVLKNKEFREDAKAHNLRLVAENASRKSVRQQRDRFYSQILNQPTV
jgi:glycosyltransferase involved in cell wall biosynthesis